MRLRFIATFGLVILAGVWFYTTRSVSTDAACRATDSSGQADSREKIAIYDGQEVPVPDIALVDSKRPVLGATSQERWIEVDLSEQKLRAWEGNNLFLETPVSTGLPGTPTPKGEFHIWSRLRYTKMEGGSGAYYYNLPNVPFVMFFENSQVAAFKGYSLHGTYWHHDFGHVHSHGCVNLPTSSAEKLYWWTMAKDNSNPGTRIVIHE